MNHKSLHALTANLSPSLPCSLHGQINIVICLTDASYVHAHTQSAGRPIKTIALCAVTIMGFERTFTWENIYQCFARTCWSMHSLQRVWSAWSVCVNVCVTCMDGWMDVHPCIHVYIYMTCMYDLYVCIHVFTYDLHAWIVGMICMYVWSVWSVCMYTYTYVHFHGTQILFSYTL